jgi:phosphoesterase RecJ-like protein
LPLKSPDLDILTLIREKHSFLLSGHEHPDGDCLGAQVALHHLLEALGKRSVIYNPDPLTRQHEFLVRSTPFSAHATGKTPPAHEAVILLDCCELSRLGALGDVLARTKPLIAVIDHHVGSEHGDGAINFVDANAPATGALVYELYKRLGQPIGKTAAEGVLLSLVSDTGWFRYSNTDANVLRIAAELVEQGVDASALFDKLFRRNHPDSPALLAEALSRHAYRLGGRLVCATIDRGTMDRASRAGFDTDQVLEPLRSVAGVEVVALCKERFDGGWKLSLRASGGVDVQAIAKQLGGGGHKKAAGATVTLPPEKVFALVEECTKRALDAPR